MMKIAVLAAAPLAAHAAYTSVVAVDKEATTYSLNAGGCMVASFEVHLTPP